MIITIHIRKWVPVYVRQWVGFGVRKKCEALTKVKCEIGWIRYFAEIADFREILPILYEILRMFAKFRIENSYLP
jgi:hypothetical protein